MLSAEKNGRSDFGTLITSFLQRGDRQAQMCNGSAQPSLVSQNMCRSLHVLVKSHGTELLLTSIKQHDGTQTQPCQLQIIMHVQIAFTHTQLSMLAGKISDRTTDFHREAKKQWGAHRKHFGLYSEFSLRMWLYLSKSQSEIVNLYPFM